MVYSHNRGRCGWLNFNLLDPYNIYILNYEVRYLSKEAIGHATKRSRY